VLYENARLSLLLRDCTQLCCDPGVWDLNVSFSGKSFPGNKVYKNWFLQEEFTFIKFGLKLLLQRDENISFRRNTQVT
jgi:hypothetical protein